MAPSTYRVGAACLATLLLCAPLCTSAAAAEGDPTVFGSLKTYVRLFEGISPEDRAATRYRLPVLQTVHAGGHDMGVDGLSLEILGFGEVEIIEPREDVDRARADLLLANVSWRGLGEDVLFVRLGRQLLHAGVANNSIVDGWHARIALPAYLFLESWGGLTAEPEFDGGRDRWQVGARIAVNPGGIGFLGVSFHQERIGGEPSRELLGLDLAWRQLRWLDVSASLHFDTIESDLSEFLIATELKLLERQLQLHLKYRRFDPTARIPKTSIFSVFVDSRYDEVSGTLGYFPRAGPLVLQGSASLLSYPDGRGAPRVVLRPRWVFDRASGQAAGLDVSRVGYENGGYWSVRAYGMWLPWDPVWVTLDVEQAFHDEPVRDTRSSTMARLNASWGFSEGWRLLADVGVTVDATYEQRWVGMLRLSYELSGRHLSRAVTR